MQVQEANRDRSSRALASKKEIQNPEPGPIGADHTS